MPTGQLADESYNALSFYRSQNILCWSKCFVPHQKYIYILWQSQTFCARQKMICIQQNCFLCRHKSFWRGTKCSQIFWVDSKNLDQHKTFCNLEKDNRWFLQNQEKGCIRTNMHTTVTEAYSDFLFSYMYPYNLIVRGQSQSLTSSFINTYYAF